MAPETIRASTPAFVPVAVAGAPVAQFCIDPSADDPVARWFVEHDWIDEPVQRAFLELIEPGVRVLDLGCHLGTFSLAASALGAEVLAVDAAPEHVRLLSLAARRNRFESLEVVHAAIADEAGAAASVPFVVRSIHGHVRTTGESGDGVIDVPRATVDELLDLAGWDSVDVVKMDIEGSEMAALRGMRRLFAGGGRPAMVLESNVAMLELFGSSVVELRSTLGDLGYELLLIDHLRPGVLVETHSEALQTECASDLLAVTTRPAGLARRWDIEAGMSKETTVIRVLDAAASPATGYRRAATDLLRHGPRWLQCAPGVSAAVAALTHDVDAEVCNVGAGWHGSAVDLVDAPEPESGGIPAGVAMVVDAVAVRRPALLERPPGSRENDDELVLRDVSFHVRHGEPVAVLSRASDAKRSELLLSVLAGRLAPAAGSIRTDGSVLRVGPRDHGLEPGLSVAENAVVLGVSLGATVRIVQSSLGDVLGWAGLAPHASTALDALDADAALRLCLAVTLEHARCAVLLLGSFPSVADAPFRRRAAARASSIGADGTAVVQVVSDAAELVIEPARALWLQDGSLRAAGHAASVIEAERLHRLGFSSGPCGWEHR